MQQYKPEGSITSLIPGNASTELGFEPTHEKAAEAYDWMGFEARSLISELQDEAIANKAEVRVMAYDFNLASDDAPMPRC